MIGQAGFHDKILEEPGEGRMGVVHKTEGARLKYTVVIRCRARKA
jgi:hypothetical protein